MNFSSFRDVIVVLSSSIFGIIMLGIIFITLGVSYFAILAVLFNLGYWVANIAYKDAITKSEKTYIQYSLFGMVITYLLINPFLVYFTDKIINLFTYSYNIFGGRF